MENTLYYGDNLDGRRAGTSQTNRWIWSIWTRPSRASRTTTSYLRTRTAAARRPRFLFRTPGAGICRGGRLPKGCRGRRPGFVGHAGLPAAVGDNDLLAYLSMMAPRLKELHRS